MTYTTLAKTILFGHGNEVDKAKEEAVRRVTLFSELYDKFGQGLTDEQVRLFLRNNAGVDIAEADTLSRTIGKLLRAHLQYLSTPVTTQELTTTSESKYPNQEVTESPGSGILGELRTPDYGILKIKDELSAEIAIRIINSLKEKIKAKGQEGEIAVVA